MAYQELDIGNSLDSDNKFKDNTFGHDQKFVGNKFP